MTTALLRVAVFGVGYLGTRHAEKLAASPHFQLTTLFDREPGKAQELASRLGCGGGSDPDAILDAVDAVVVATSTPSHREVAEHALSRGCHVLVEKPLTGHAKSAESVVRAAREHGKVLHVGHVERFNPALRGLIGKLDSPLFVESHRLAPLVPRNLDINVVQDLMVHDIDLALKFIGEEPERVEAMGVPVLSDRVDIANARLRFPGGAVANLTASRVSLERVRKFRMFLPGTYVSADCAQREGRLYRLKDGREDVLREVLAGGHPLEMLKVLDQQKTGPEGPDPLESEHEAFALAIRGEANEGVTGEETLSTLRTLEAVERDIEVALKAR